MTKTHILTAAPVMVSMKIVTTNNTGRRHRQQPLICPKRKPQRTQIDSDWHRLSDGTERKHAPHAIIRTVHYRRGRCDAQLDQLRTVNQTRHRRRMFQIRRSLQYIIRMNRRHTITMMRMRYRHRFLVRTPTRTTTTTTTASIMHLRTSNIYLWTSNSLCFDATEKNHRRHQMMMKTMMMMIVRKACTCLVNKR